MSKWEPSTEPFTPEQRAKYASVAVLSPGYGTSTRTLRRTHGRQVEHWSGRVDAHITAPAVKMRTRKDPDSGQITVTNG